MMFSSNNPKGKEIEKMYHWKTMKKPLEFPVCCGKKTVIPVGAKRVRIAFGQSHLVRNVVTGACYGKPFSEPLNENEKRCNVYQRSWNAPLIHA